MSRSHAAIVDDENDRGLRRLKKAVGERMIISHL